MSRSFSPVAIIFLFSSLVYFNTLENGFHLDDFYRVLDNPGIQKVMPASRHFWDPKTISFLPSLEVYRPLLPLSLSLNYAIHQYSLAGYHLVNASIHFLATLMVYLLCRLLMNITSKKLASNSRAIGLIVALVFAIHPVSGYPVNYICGRDLLMMQFFIIASLYYYIRMRMQEENPLGWCKVLSLYLLALLSKQNALVMPAIIVAFEWVLMKKPFFSRAIWFRIAPFTILIMGVMLFIKYSLGFSDVDKLWGGNEWSTFWVYPLTQFKIHLFDYGSNFLWPWGINASPYVNPANLTDAGAWVGFAFVVSTLLLAYRLYKTMPIISFSILGYWILLAPTSSLIPLIHLQFDYRPYPSSIFLYLAVSSFAFFYFKRTTATAGSILILIYFSISAIQYNSIWKNEESLWKHSVQSNGSPLAHLNYAMAVKDLKLRENHLRTALEQNPKYVLAKMNLGITLIHSGKKEEGLNWAKKATQADPNSGRIQFWLANAYRLTGDHPNALLKFIQAAKLKPIKKYQYEAGLELTKAKQFEESLYFLKRIYHEDPEYKKTGHLLGYAYQKTEKVEESIPVYKAYLKNHKNEYQPLFNLGYAYMQIDDCPAAIKAFNSTLNLNPNYLEVHSYLSNCHKKLGHEAQAAKHQQLGSTPRNNAS